MRSWSSAVAISVAITMGACGPDRTPKEPDPQLQAATGAATRPSFVGADAQSRAIWQDERRFYAQNGYQLAWSDGKRPRRTMDALVRAIQAAPDDGLDPADYDVDALTAAREPFDATRADEIDLHFTYAYLKYASHLARGARRPEEANRSWHAADRSIDLVASLQAGVNDDSVEPSLQALVPKARQYHGLRTQLARYRERGASEDEIRTIAVNMDRWRRMPDDLGPRYLLVNIPAFRLDAFEEGRSVLDMKVVAGRKEDPTPVLADRMTHIVFSPYWNIPASIVKEEILPRLEDDPAYLERQNIEMVGGSGESEDVRFRQRPGPRNALGLVKFMFPNTFNVYLYLHDTPADSLFNREGRDFSHGCVRVERPLELAKYILGDQPDWTEARIQSAMHAGSERTVTLKEPIPVYLAYLTAWEDNGTLQIRPDVYGHDRAQRE